MPTNINTLTGMPQPRSKYLKGAARGGEIESGVNVVAKGDQKLGYHADVERRKEDAIRDLIKAVEARKGHPVYMSQHKALAMLTFYGLDMSTDAKQINSAAPIFMEYDRTRNQFYLIYR